MPRSNNELFLTLILSGIATIFEQYGLIWFLVICTLCLESITYYMAAKAKGRKVRTNKKRILKVTSQIVSLMFGLLLDALEAYLISHSNEMLGITFKASIPFGIIICVYIILSESINILNNLDVSGAHFPPIVMRFLKTLKEKISEVDLPISDTVSLVDSAPAIQPVPVVKSTSATESVVASVSVAEPVPDLDESVSALKEPPATHKTPLPKNKAQRKPTPPKSKKCSSGEVKTSTVTKTTNKSSTKDGEGKNDNA